MITEETRSKLRRFFLDRPSLNKKGIEREAGLPEGKIKFVFSHMKHHLNPEQYKNLVKILRNYGWKGK